MPFVLSISIKNANVGVGSREYLCDILYCENKSKES